MLISDQDQKGSFSETKCLHENVEEFCMSKGLLQLKNLETLSMLELLAF
jgi:hypothetical protein